MMEKLIKKLHSRAGESIAETLVAVLIAALSLTLLAGAISTSTSVIKKTREKLSDYYDDCSGTGDKGVAWMSAESGTALEDGIALSMADVTYPIKYDITYYINGEFSQAPVVSYKKSE